MLEKELDRVERSDAIIIPGKNIGVGWSAEDIASENNRWHLSDHTRVSDLAAIIEYKKARKRGLSPKLVLTSGATARARMGDTLIDFNEARLMQQHIQKIAPSIPDEAFILEDVSRDTAENAEKVSEIVRVEDIRTVGLVTVGFHTNRSEMLFKNRHVPITTTVASEDVLEHKFPRFVKNYKNDSKYHYQEEVKKEKRAKMIQSIPVLGRVASELIRRARSGKVVEVSPKAEDVKEEIVAQPGVTKYELMSEYKRGKDRHYRTFDEVYWRREGQNGVTYLKRMTPDGQTTVITDDHGRLSVNTYNMNELVIPVPAKGGSFWDVFKPNNWKPMRNHEYLEETSLKVGELTSDGTKVTGIEVLRNRLLAAEPDGLIGDFRNTLKKAGYIDLSVQSTEQKNDSDSASAKEKIIFGQPEEKQIELGLESDKAPGQAGVWEEGEGAQGQVPATDASGNHEVPGDISESSVGESEKSRPQAEEIQALQDKSTGEAAPTSNAEVGQTAEPTDFTEYFEHHDGTFIAMSTNKAVYRVLGRRALAKIIYDEKLSLEERREKIKIAYTKKRKNNDPEIDNLILVQTTVNLTS